MKLQDSPPGLVSRRRTLINTFTNCDFHQVAHIHFCITITHLSKRAALARSYTSFE